MTTPVMGLFRRWEAPDASARGLSSRLARAVWYKANPRDEAYMRRLFAERYPDGVFVCADREADWPARLVEGASVVLLYPDAIGQGFGRIEAVVGARPGPARAPRVLNGRGRDFALDRATRRALALRRFLERTMLIELAFVPFFVVLTPLLLTVDGLRGRR